MFRVLVYILLIYLGYKGWRWLKANVRLDSSSPQAVRGEARPKRKRIKVDQSQVEDVEFEEED